MYFQFVNVCFQEHDSYRAFRSQNVNMSVSFDVKPQEGAGVSSCLFYGSTLRWLDKVKVSTIVVSNHSLPTHIISSISPNTYLFLNVLWWTIKSLEMSTEGHYYIYQVHISQLHLSQLHLCNWDMRSSVAHRLNTWLLIERARIWIHFAAISKPAHFRAPRQPISLSCTNGLRFESSLRIVILYLYIILQLFLPLNKISKVTGTSLLPSFPLHCPPFCYHITSIITLSL